MAWQSRELAVHALRAHLAIAGNLVAETFGEGKDGAEKDGAEKDARPSAVGKDSTPRPTPRPASSKR